jgi:hypothetical protein
MNNNQAQIPGVYTIDIDGTGLGFVPGSGVVINLGDDVPAAHASHNLLADKIVGRIATIMEDSSNNPTKMRLLREIFREIMDAIDFEEADF